MTLRARPMLPTYIRLTLSAPGLRRALTLVLLLLAVKRPSQTMENGLLKLGGFRCVDLVPLRNDPSFDLYQVGYFTYGAFRMDVWKRHGVPFLYPHGAGDIRVAGPAWQPPAIDIISDASAGATAWAGSTDPGNGAIRWANDGELGTY